MQGIVAAKSVEALVEVWGLKMEECRKEGKKFVQALKDELKARDPTAYGDDEPLPTAEGEENAQPDIWEQRKQAEEKGEVVDQPPEEEVLKQEEMDEEELTNS